MPLPVLHSDLGEPETRGRGCRRRWRDQLEVGVAEVEGEAKMVSRLTLLLLGVAAGEANRMSLEDDLSKSDSISLVAAVGG